MYQDHRMAYLSLSLVLQFSSQTSYPFLFSDQGFVSFKLYHLFF